MKLREKEDRRRDEAYQRLRALRGRALLKNRPLGKAKASASVGGERVQPLSDTNTVRAKVADVQHSWADLTFRAPTQFMDVHGTVMCPSVDFLQTYTIILEYIR
jgi:hypothetical protein